MSDNIKNFRLSDIQGNEGYKRVLLQLFGLPGNGKSSFINSCKFVLDGGEFTTYAESGNSQGGHTTKRVSYKITESICMVDNRGMPTLNRFQTGEIFAQLANVLPLNEEVEWVKEYDQNVDRLMTGINNEDNLYDLIVPVFIHSMKYDIQNEADEYRDLLNTARDLTGVTPYVVLTHKHGGQVKYMKSVFKDMGMNKIYTIENYTLTDRLIVRERHQEIIKFFTEVLEDIKFRMMYMNDPKKERAKHMAFILKYIKETSDLKKKEEHEKEMRNQMLFGRGGVSGGIYGSGSGSWGGYGVGNGHRIPVESGSGCVLF